MSYSTKVLDHYEIPVMSELRKDDEGVATAWSGAACGDVMKLQIKVNRTV